MAKTNFENVDAYLASLAPRPRAILKQVRAILRKALPQAEEVISYQIPAYKQDGATVIYCAAWSEHFSLYPAGGVAEALGHALDGYEISKGTIRFPFEGGVPRELIARIAHARAQLAQALVQERLLARAGKKAAAKNAPVAKKAAAKKVPVKKKAVAKKASAKKLARKPTPGKKTAAAKKKA